jgi:hypothetical protein
MVLQQAGMLQVPDEDRIEAGVDDESLGNLLSVRVGSEQVARALGSRATGDGLDLVRLRRELGGAFP